VDWVGVQNLIEPFWNRMPQIFSYPVSMHPLILIAVLAVLSTLLSGPGIFSALVNGVMWLIVVKYSFESLKATAGGNLKPPPISSKTISRDFFQVFKQFGIYIAIFIAFVWLVKDVGSVVGLVFLTATLFFVPSIVILLVTTRSLIHALNPVVFVGLTFSIGWAYF
jgi:hypothetical protein